MLIHSILIALVGIARALARACMMRAEGPLSWYNGTLASSSRWYDVADHIRAFVLAIKEGPMTSKAPVDHQMVKASHVRRRVKETTGTSVETGPHPLVKLQRQVGNATIARTLAQREAPEEELQAKHDHEASHGSPEVGYSA